MDGRKIIAKARCVSVLLLLSLVTMTAQPVAAGEDVYTLDYTLAWGTWDGSLDEGWGLVLFPQRECADSRPHQGQTRSIGGAVFEYCGFDTDTFYADVHDEVAGRDVPSRVSGCPGDGPCVGGEVTCGGSTLSLDATVDAVVVHVYSVFVDVGLEACTGFSGTIDLHVYCPEPWQRCA